MSFGAGLLTAGIIGTSIFALRLNAQKGQAKWVANTLAQGSDKPTINIGAKKDRWGDVRCDIHPYDHFDSISYADAENLPYEDKKFSVALLSHVLEHLDNPEIALKEAQRIADNVVVVLPEPTHPWTWADPEHKWVFLGEQRIRNQPSVVGALLGSLAMAGFIIWRSKAVK